MKYLFVGKELSGLELGGRMPLSIGEFNLFSQVDKHDHFLCSDVAVLKIVFKSILFFSRVLPHQKTRSSAALIFRPTLVVLLHRCQRRRRLLRVRHPLENSGQWIESRQSS